ALEAGEAEGLIEAAVAGDAEVGAEDDADAAPDLAHALGLDVGPGLVEQMKARPVEREGARGGEEENRNQCGSFHRSTACYCKIYADQCVPVVAVALVVVTGFPPPVSVAVVPVVCGVDWIVSVDPTEVAAGLRLQVGTASRTSATAIAATNDEARILLGIAPPPGEFSNSRADF